MDQVEYYNQELEDDKKKLKETIIRLNRLKGKDKEEVKTITHTHTHISFLIYSLFTLLNVIDWLASQLIFLTMLLLNSILYIDRQLPVQRICSRLQDAITNALVRALGHFHQAAEKSMNRYEAQFSYLKTWKHSVHLYRDDFLYHLSQSPLFGKQIKSKHISEIKKLKSNLDMCKSQAERDSLLGTTDIMGEETKERRKGTNSFSFFLRSTNYRASTEQHS